jgi:hypothetical protein
MHTADNLAKLAECWPPSNIGSIDYAMKPRTLDDEIARHLEEARRSGELQQVKGYGQPFVEDEGWLATPEALRMPFKILKDAGVVPPEIEMFRELARLKKEVLAATDETVKHRLEGEHQALEQRIRIRLEALRASGSL